MTSSKVLGWISHQKVTNYAVNINLNLDTQVLRYKLKICRGSIRLTSTVVKTQSLESIKLSKKSSVQITPI